MNQEAFDLIRKREVLKDIKDLTALEEAGKMTDAEDIGQLVGILHKIEHYEEALAIVRRHSGDRELDYAHVKILKATERFEEAESVRQKAFDHALERLKHAQPGKEKADCLNAVGLLEADPKRQIVHFKMSLEEDPDDFVVNYNLAKALERDGHIDKALKYARRIVELEPNDRMALELVKQLEKAQRLKEIDSRAESSIKDRSSEFQRLQSENATRKTATSEWICKLDDLTAKLGKACQRRFKLETELIEGDANVEAMSQIIHKLRHESEAYIERIDSLEACNAKLCKEIECRRSKRSVEGAVRS